MTQYPKTAEEQIGSCFRYNLESTNHNKELDMGNSIDVFRWTMDKYRGLVHSISYQLVHKQSHADSIRKELEKAKLTIEDKNKLISILEKKQMLDTKEISRLYKSLMSKSEQKLSKDGTSNDMQSNSEIDTLKENCDEKPDSLKVRLSSSESELRKLKENLMSLKRKVDLESSNI